MLRKGLFGGLTLKDCLFEGVVEFGDLVFKVVAKGFDRELVQFRLACNVDLELLEALSDELSEFLVHCRLDLHLFRDDIGHARLKLV